MSDIVTLDIPKEERDAVAAELFAKYGIDPGLPNGHVHFAVWASREILKLREELRARASASIDLSRSFIERATLELAKAFGTGNAAESALELAHDICDLVGHDRKPFPNERCLRCGDVEGEKEPQPDPARNLLDFVEVYAGEMVSGVPDGDHDYFWALYRAYVLARPAVTPQQERRTELERKEPAK